MDVETFAAERAERLKGADEFLRPFVETALTRLRDGEADWDADLIDAAARIWHENFQAEAPGARFLRAQNRFRASLSDALDKTSQEPVVTDAQIDRITNWLSTYSVNAGTTSGAFAKGVRYKKWVTMGDSAVREIHRPLDGQVRPIGGTFDVAGTKLGYPGEPVGPPEVWINCRCVAMPASREGEPMSANTYVLGPEDQIDEDENPDVVVGEKLTADAVMEDVEAEAEMVGDDAEWDALPAEIPIYGIAAPEGIETGDGRLFSVGSLSTREPPMTIAYQTMTGEYGHVNSVTVGRIDATAMGTLDDVPVMEYTGVLLKNRPAAREAYFGIKDGSGRGVSVDVDKAVMAPPPEPEDDEDFFDMLFGPQTMEFSEARIAGLTIVGIPAFESKYAHIALDGEKLAACGCNFDVIDLSNDPEANARAASEAWFFKEYDQEARDRMADEGTAMPDGSYPIADCEDLSNAIQAIGRAKDPEATKAHIRKRKSALGCEDVELPEDWSVIVAAAPIFTLVASGGVTYPAEFFEAPKVDRATPLTIDPDTRHVYGHLAEWRSCHLGITGICTEAPHTESDYAYFLKGVTATTGGDIRTGVLTHAIGHAGERMSAAQATAHYDRDGSMWAQVALGEDDYGIWFSGVIPSWVSDDVIDKVRAIGAVSGDWRAEFPGAPLELRGVVTVPVPGFQLPRFVADGGYQTVLVAAGRIAPEPKSTAFVTLKMDPDTIAAIARTAVAEMRHLEKRSETLGPIRQDIRSRALANARAVVSKGQ